MSSDYPLMNIVHGNEPLSGVDLSVVVPVYACAGSLSELHRRLTAVLSELVDRYEIVFVDDRARDGSWAMLQKMAAKDPNVVACRLSRNFGQQLAITAGLAECCGEYAIVMDCDLQDPPEFIPNLLAEARRGFDIVLANRRSDYHFGLRGPANRFYFWLLGAVSGRKISGDPGSFSIISRRVIDAFLGFKERDRHYLMVLNWLGFDLSTIDFDRAPRTIGRSSYTFRMLIAHAFSGVLFSTTRLLHFVIYIGIALAGSAALLALFFVVHWIANGATPGWTSLIVVQLLVGGIITMCVGVTGLYIGKIFEASQQRPLYFIQDRIGKNSTRGEACEPKYQASGI
jgi:glycosyltransferase involved in cell wall biosynthesis